VYTQRPELVEELSLVLKGYVGQIPAGKRVGWINLAQ
jgi:hypothetical protein